jgi:hypothetical protein
MIDGSSKSQREAREAVDRAQNPSPFSKNALLETPMRVTMRMLKHILFATS